MSRAVYIGGFGNGKLAAGRVAEALTKYYQDVEPFTFSYAMDNPDIIRKAVEDVDVFTHSAGMLPVTDTSPRMLTSFGPPLPTPKGVLVVRTLAKTVRMHTPGVGLRSVADIPAIAAYDLSTTGEFVSNPCGNFGRLGEVACFNAIDTAIYAQHAGIPTKLMYTQGDEYYAPSVADVHRATMSGVDVVRGPGVHDELVIRPDQTLRYTIFR